MDAVRNQISHLDVGEIVLFLSCINEFRDVLRSQTASVPRVFCSFGAIPPTALCRCFAANDFGFSIPWGLTPTGQDGGSRLDISQNLQTSPTIRAVVKRVLWLI